MSQQTASAESPHPIADNITVKVGLTEDTHIRVVITMPVKPALTAIQYLHYSHYSCTNKMATALDQAVEQADTDGSHDETVTAELNYQTASWSTYLTSCLTEASTWAKTDRQLAQLHAFKDALRTDRRESLKSDPEQS